MSEEPPFDTRPFFWGVTIALQDENRCVWVLESDYLNMKESLEAENARLKAEVERLNKAGDAMASGLQGMAGERVKALADEWNEANGVQS